MLRIIFDGIDYTSNTYMCIINAYSQIVYLSLMTMIYAIAIHFRERKNVCRSNEYKRNLKKKSQQGLLQISVTFNSFVYTDDSCGPSVNYFLVSFEVDHGKEFD